MIAVDASAAGIRLAVGGMLAGAVWFCVVPVVHAQSLATQQAGQAAVQQVNGGKENLPALNADASRQAQAMRPQSGAPAGTPTAQDVATNGGNVAELQRRIANKELAELRTVYNGSYGASLLMATNDTTYYVALFERKNFWRVVKTSDMARADAIFRDFAAQTSDLAQSEIRAVQLAAQRSQTEMLIDVNKERAARIQADLAIQQTQQEAVNERQRQSEAQMAQLAEENRAAQAQLADLQKQLADLQRQQNAGLPTAGTPTRTSGKRSR
ncbi:DUF2968 domain-containing protein [Robbsia andropogonis]|uniref:DUF2968 domain-containing protein n=1 Tax=Robbsia andropogonis TaxID=28092 RepID=UPI002A6AE6E0|nr:DUF2968 domain-containing protein [Robbsia andropogonis]